MSRAAARFFRGPHPTAGHFSPAVRAGDFVYVAGQVPRDADGTVVGSDVAQQTAATLENLERALLLASATLSDVIKATVHLARLEDAAAFNAVYARYFPGTAPVRTTVQSGLRGVLVEIDAVAWAPAGAVRTAASPAPR